MIRTIVDYIPRSVTPVLLEALTESRVVCIIGPRQAGKSTLLRAVIGGSHPASYVTLDDPATLDSARSDPTAFVSGERPLAIDEVQRAPELLLAIKRIVDVDQRRGQFLLTGSADILKLASVADALPGRIDYLTLWPLSQQEINRHSVPLLEQWMAGQVDAHTTQAIDPDRPAVGREAYVERLVAGGFPEVLDASATRRARFFTGYLNTMLGRDLPDVGSVRRTEVVGRLMRLTAARSGGIISMAALARELSIDAKTAASYLSLLEQLFLVIRLPSWQVNLGTRVLKAPKLHVSDTGMLCALLGADSNRLLRDPGLFGKALETFLVTELLRQAASSPNGLLLHFHHYRDQRGVEVDLVIEHAAGDVVAVEVKSSATPRAADAAALRMLRDRLGQRFRTGILVHLGPQTLALGDRLHAVPLQALF